LLAALNGGIGASNFAAASSAPGRFQPTSPWLQDPEFVY
jgi:hypothetical protein